MKKISVVITTHNSSRTIGKCIEAVKWADEILVVDSNSTDGTIQICREYPNCKVLQSPRNLPNISRNYGYEQASGDWVLTLDSDEMVPAALAEEIKAIVSSEGGYDGYLAAGREFMFGKWIYYAQGEKHRPQRYFLFRKGYMKYECKRIHEMPVIKGRWGYLKNWFDHEPPDCTISNVMNKINRYTDMNTETLITLNEAVSTFRWYRMFLFPLKNFLTMYIKHQGFRDGGHGFILSALVSFNIFLEYAKLWEFIYLKNAPGREAGA